MKSTFDNIHKNFHVVRLGEADVRARSDHFQNLKGLLLAHQEMYPEISKWINQKVTPGIRESERVGFIGYLDEKPVISAVVKRGAVAKFCHLHVDDRLQQFNLGELFFSLMANEVRDLAQRVYFTLPESVWSSKGEFFRSFNFSNLHKANTQYRLFEEELECDAAFEDVWSAVAVKLPKICSAYSLDQGCLATDLLMSIQPKYVEKIFNGEKRYELRRKFSTKWLGHRMNIYATEPAMELVGQAIVNSIIRNTPGALWERLGNQLGCSYEDFKSYTQGAEEIFAIELADITPYRIPVGRKEIISILNEKLVPPQSYCSIKSNKPWGIAVSLASLLQGAFSMSMNSHWKKLFKTDKEALTRG